MSEPLNRQPVDDQLVGEAGEGGDAVLADLALRNLARAVVDGGLGARAELGAAIGRLLCGGKRER